jgi:dTDP-4-amino-4,6-dideoxygalactose transaminase
MSNVCAGIGRGQLSVIDERVTQRRNNFRFYQKALSHISQIWCNTEPGTSYFSNHWLTTILIDSNGFDREDLRHQLVDSNIDCRPLWKPMHLQPLYSGTQFYGDDTSDRLFQKGLCLPSGSNLTKDQLFKVVSIINQVSFANQGRRIYIDDLMMA